MSNKSTKQLMQDLQAAIKDLKGLHSDRSKIIEDLKTSQTTKAEEQSKETK